jgi:hypothetical protein
LLLLCLLRLLRCRLAVKLMQGGVILGVTGSFAAAGSVGGLDASGRFRQPTLMAAVGGSKGGGNSGGGKKGSGNGKMGPGSGSGKGGGGSGGRQLQEHQAGRKKPRLYGEGGAWSGCCLCGIKAKVCACLRGLYAHHSKLAIKQEGRR